MTLTDPEPGFQGHDIFEVEYLKKRCISGTKLLKNTNRKPYTIYQMIPLSVTFDPHFNVRTFSTLNISEMTRDRAIVTIERQ